MSGLIWHLRQQHPLYEEAQTMSLWQFHQTEKLIFSLVDTETTSLSQPKQPQHSLL
jgi:hypothetical protein